MNSKHLFISWVLWLSSPLAWSQATVPTADARHSGQAAIRQRADKLANECQTMVSFRLGGLMTLRIERVVEPVAPATIWAVVGEDKKKTPPISFICQFAQKGQGWELSKLELLQLAPETKVTQSPAP